MIIPETYYTQGNCSHHEATPPVVGCTLDGDHLDSLLDPPDLPSGGRGTRLVEDPPTTGQGRSRRHLRSVLRSLAACAACRQEDVSLGRGRRAGAGRAHRGRPECTDHPARG